MYFLFSESSVGNKCYSYNKCDNSNYKNGQDIIFNSLRNVTTFLIIDGG